MTVITADWGSANAINASGQIVGYATAGGPYGYAFLSSGGTMTTLGNLGGTYSCATAINAIGQIVGNSTTAGSNYHALLYSGGSMSDLGTLPGCTQSYATGINASGQIVGYATAPGTGYSPAFLYSNGSMTNLNNLISPTSNWLQLQPNAINDSGWIVGTGINASGLHDAFLLTPIPEPGYISWKGGKDDL